MEPKDENLHYKAFKQNQNPCLPTYSVHGPYKLMSSLLKQTSQKSQSMKTILHKKIYFFFIDIPSSW